MEHDFVTDQNPGILKFAKSWGNIPAYISQGDTPSADEVAGLSSNAFGDVANRLFPCHTKEATWYSAAYWALSGNGNQHILERIKKAADSHEITPDIYNILDNTLQMLEKTASQFSQDTPQKQDVPYALTLKMSDGTLDNYYPMHTKEAVAQSSYMANQAHLNSQIPLDIFVKVARELVKTAHSYDMDIATLPEFIIHYGEDKTPQLEKAKIGIQLRKTAGADVDAYIQKINEYEDKINPALGIEASLKAAYECADAIYEMDKAANIRYSFPQQDPYTLILSGVSISNLKKMASSSVKVSGVYVPKAEFASLPESAINDVLFTQSDVENIKQACTIIKTGVGLADETMAAEACIEKLSSDSQKHLLSVLVNANWT